MACPLCALLRQTLASKWRFNERVALEDTGASSSLQDYALLGCWSHSRQRTPAQADSGEGIHGRCAWNFSRSRRGREFHVARCAGGLERGALNRTCFICTDTQECLQKLGYFSLDPVHLATQIEGPKADPSQLRSSTKRRLQCSPVWNMDRWRKVLLESF